MSRSQNLPNRARVHGPKAAGLTGPAASNGCIAGCAVSVHHNVIYCPHTRVIGEVDMHVGAGPDRALHSFPLAVEDMAGTVENVMARTLVVNNESFRRLIACRLTSFNRYAGLFP